MPPDFLFLERNLYSHDITFLVEEKHGHDEIDDAKSERDITCKVNEAYAIDNAQATLSSIQVENMAFLV